MSSEIRVKDKESLDSYYDLERLWQDGEKRHLTFADEIYGGDV